MSNKSTGTRFEREFSRMLHEHGFWVHRFQDNKNGQPCDIIAAKDGNTYLFDCKNCESNYFYLRRMEENQYNAMLVFEISGNSRGMMAIRFPDQTIWLVQYWEVKALLEGGINKITRENIKRHGIQFYDWIQRNRGDETCSC